MDLEKNGIHLNGLRFNDLKCKISKFHICFFPSVYDSWFGLGTSILSAMKSLIVVGSLRL